MTFTAAQKTAPLTSAVEVDLMAILVMLVEWMLKQLQLLTQQNQIEKQKKELEKQEKKLEALKEENLQLKEELDKLKNRSSQNSSVPPSQDLLKKPSNKSKRKKGKKRGPKYNHCGKTRNGFGVPDHIEQLWPSLCPACGNDVEQVAGAPKKVQQVAELVEQPVEIREYQRGLCKCQSCGWSGYGPLPWGIKEGFSYGGRLSSVVGWLGYGGNLTWRKQEYFVEHVLGVPISQGSLASMHRWFTESLEPCYQNWLAYVQQPGVRCVDETTYCIDGIKYWVWVATSDQVCVLLLAPTRSSAELKQLLGENFSGILSRDCFSAYGPQIAAAKQKCLAHLERDLDALKTSRFAANVDFAEKIKKVLWTARKAHQDYHTGLLRTEQQSATTSKCRSSITKNFGSASSFWMACRRPKTCLTTRTSLE